MHHGAACTPAKARYDRTDYEVGSIVFRLLLLTLLSGKYLFQFPDFVGVVVEAAGVEPASANLLILVLHA